MRKWITLVENLINEIDIGKDFDDKLVQDRFDTRFQEEADKAKHFDYLNDAYEIRSDFNSYRNYFYLIDRDTGVLKGKINLDRFNDTCSVVSHVWIAPDIRRTGLGFEFYTLLLKHGFLIKADSSQTKAAKKLWEKLAREGYVYLYDTDMDRIGKQVNKIAFAYNPNRRHRHITLIAKH